MPDYYYKGILCLSYGFMRKRPDMPLDNQPLSASVPYTGQSLEHGEIIASKPEYKSTISRRNRYR